MRLFHTFGAAVAMFGTLALASTDAQASITAKCPRGSKPVIFVHGRGENQYFRDVHTGKLKAKLKKSGYCFENTFQWGVERAVQDGKYYAGHGHLKNGAEELSRAVALVLKRTGAKKVGLVTHSAGQGVADYYLQKMNGNEKVYADVSIAGLHHPYAYVGLRDIVDAEIYLPALGVLGPILEIGRKLLGFIPNAAVAGSSFVGDLFNDGYWRALQGPGLAEPVISTIAVEGSVGPFAPGITSLKNDAAKGVCYMNIVSKDDNIVGRLAGFQFKQKGNGISYTNYANARRDHTFVLHNADALGRTITGLNDGWKDCGGGGDSNGGPINGH